jgi:hypothetical protein
MMQTISKGLVVDLADTAGYVLVYQYRHWNPSANVMEVSKDMATLDAIKSGLGIPMSETGLKVTRGQIDGAGRYRPAHASQVSSARAPRG